MIVKVDDYKYLNINLIPSFVIRHSDCTNGMSFRYGDNYIEMGDGQECNEWWCNVIRKYFEIALAEGEPFFDLHAMTEEQMNDKVKKIYEHEIVIEEARIRREKERKETLEKKAIIFTNPKDRPL
jgi:hypothetical protein